MGHSLCLSRYTRVSSGTNHFHKYADLIELLKAVEAVGFQFMWSDNGEIGWLTMNNQVSAWLKTGWPYTECPQVQESMGALGLIYGPRRNAWL